MQNLIDGMSKNGIANLAKMTRQDTGQSMLYFGAKTINNLPIIFEVAHPQGGN